MTNKKCILPEKSFKLSKKGYEEIHVPAPEGKSLEAGERLLPIKELPRWAQPAFQGFNSLNRIQSKLAPVALENDENILLCAPTGAGKTNVALLSMLQVIGNNLKSDENESSGLQVNLEAFKIVYIAPMKALVQEMVKSFTNRLAPFGMNVAELTGDSNLTRAQLASTQVIVTTPEKWDVVTRKNTEASSFVRLVKLVIIDEIHLLHDDRGPVLESIVTRTLRQAEQTQEWVRLVGLSATLPNYVDVARFLRVNPKSGLFFFDASFRPCPLAQQFIGITEKKPLKALALMNEICYEKALVDVQDRNQVLIFVHSRKETAKCAKTIRDLAIQNGTIGKFLPSEATKNALAEAVDGTRNSDLKDLLSYGFAIHHAGMTRADRTLVEEMFAAGNLQVLVSTATLAWGVNLPAHTVIIRGTRVYSPERGSWTELNSQDVLQMLGRAGRPQYDTFGSGIILTTHSELQYYLSLMNSQLPIESQLMRRLVDVLNAEIVLGMVRSVDEAVNWLGYTFMYVRMVQEPHLYGVDLDSEEGKDPKLVAFRRRLIHSAATSLERANLIKYDRRNGTIVSTELGRIASYYYLTHQSMLIYGQNLRPIMDEIDLFRLFAQSSEFKMIPIRAEEKIELASLAERIPIPVKEVATEDPLAKVNILLQAYISQLSLEGFALVSDLVYITQSAGRLLRAIFEICLRRGWARVAHKALEICKMVEHCQWLSHSPLRQIPEIPSELVRRVERKDFPFERLFDLNPAELGELVRAPKQGKVLFDALKNFPRVSLVANILPLTRKLLRIELSVTPEFDWSESATNSAEPFWLTVEDVDQEQVLFADSFILRRSQCVRGEALFVTINVPILDPLPPLYFVRLVSDRWLHSEAKLAINLMQLKLPVECPPPTALLDLAPLTPQEAFVKHPELAESVFAEVEQFSAIQTQVFPALYRSDESVFVGSPSGSDSLMAAEFALCRHFLSKPSSRVVYLCPVDEVSQSVQVRLQSRFKDLIPRPINRLTGELSTDLKLLDASSIVIANPRHWDLLTRRWKQRKVVQSVALVIADLLHYLGRPEIGPQYEIALSRTRFISAQLEEAGGSRIRIVALSECLANAHDVADWLGCPQVAIFNFDASARSTPLRIHLQGFAFDDTVSNNQALLASMTRPAFLSILEQFEEEEAEESGPCAIIYVDNRKQARSLAVDLMTLTMAESARLVNSNNLSEDYSLFVRGSPMEIDGVTETTLSALMPHGIAYYHESLSGKDKSIVTGAFNQGRVKVVIVSRTSMWEFEPSAPLVIVFATHHYEGRERRFVEYPLSDIFCMLGHTQSRSSFTKALLLTTNAMKPFYKHVLYENLPIESHLDQFLYDPFNSEIVSRVITSKQDAVDYLTWTFLYRRLPLNPHYYNLASASHRHISDHLSELVETTLETLSEARCIQIVDEMYVEPLNLGMISAYYNVHYGTIEMMASSLQANTRLRGILQVISAAAEFDWLIEVRSGEEAVLSALHSRCQVRLGAASLKFHDPHVKVAILLQCHFSRVDLPAELQGDLEIILNRIVPLTYALIDVLSSQGWLAPALAAMEFCQMSVQALWDSDSPLRQLPHFTGELVAAAAKFGCETISEFVDLDDSDKLALLKGIPGRAIAEIAAFANEYPSDLEVALMDGAQVPCKSGEDVTISVNLSIERESNHFKPPRFPSIKEISWWVVLGNPVDRTILAIKRVTIPVDENSRKVELDFAAPESSHETSLSLKVYVLCDSFMGCDQELDFSLLIQ